MGNHVEILQKLIVEWPTAHSQYCVGGGTEISNGLDKKYLEFA